MAPRLGRLFPRRSSRRDSAAAAEPSIALDSTSIDLEEWDQRPVLLPAAIFRQVLVDSTEVTPSWLKPRPPGLLPSAVNRLTAIAEEPAIAEATTEDPKLPTRKRQRKAAGSSAPSRTEPKRAKRAKDPPTEA